MKTTQKEKIDTVSLLAVESPQDAELSREALAQISRRPRGRRLRVQVQHARLAPDVLRDAVWAWWGGMATQAQQGIHRDLSGDHMERWARQMGSDPAKVEVVRVWLAGGDALAVAKAAEVGRATAFRWVESYLRACSWWSLRAELESFCDITHRSAGGDGRTPAIGRRNHSAGSCEVCALLRGASWDGWITVE